MSAIWSREALVRILLAPLERGIHTAVADFGLEIVIDAKAPTAESISPASNSSTSSPGSSHIIPLDILAASHDTIAGAPTPAPLGEPPPLAAGANVDPKRPRLRVRRDTRESAPEALNPHSGPRSETAPRSLTSPERSIPPFDPRSEAASQAPASPSPPAMSNPERSRPRRPISTRTDQSPPRARIELNVHDPSQSEAPAFIPTPSRTTSVRVRTRARAPSTSVAEASPAPAPMASTPLVAGVSTPSEPRDSSTSASRPAPIGTAQPLEEQHLADLLTRAARRHGIEI